MMINNKSEKIIYIISGPNGVGKTTFGKAFSHEKNIEYFNADDFALLFNKSNPEKVKLRAGKKFLKTIYNSLNLSKSFALETALSGKYLLNFIKKAKKFGYLIILIYIFVLDYKLCVHRIKHRVNLGGHYISDEDVKRRYYRSLKNFELYKQLVDVVYLIYNGDDDFEEIAILKNGKIEIFNEEIYKIFQEITHGFWKIYKWIKKWYY